MITLNALLADAPLSEPTPLHSPSNIVSDPLVNNSSQLLIYIGLALMVIIVTVLVGFLSRRVEHAIFAALVLSLAIIVFLNFM